MRLRLLLHTAFYILSVAAVITSAAAPAQTAAFLRRHTSTRSTPPPNTSAQNRSTQTRSRDLRPGQYRVAIGTVLTARLRSGIDSRTAQANDQIDAVLTGPVVQDGVELIPGGSVLHGSVVRAEAATRNAPLGRIEIVFTVVQHADTRSRAAIRTRPATFAAEAPADPAPGKRPKKLQPIDVTLSPGQPLALTLADTLLVYIPTAR